jgi:hypothetical protein
MPARYLETDTRAGLLPELTAQAIWDLQKSDKLGIDRDLMDTVDEHLLWDVADYGDTVVFLPIQEVLLTGLDHSLRRSIIESYSHGL